MSTRPLPRPRRGARLRPGCAPEHPAGSYAGLDRLRPVPRARRHWLVTGGLVRLGSWRQAGVAPLLAQEPRERA